MALTEAISHLNKRLDLIPTLPWSSERDVSELSLRSLLGTTWMALKSSAAPEVWTSLHPALALAKSLKRHDALAPILWGLANNVQTQGCIAEALPWMQEMLEQIPFASERERVKKLAKTRSWSRFREGMRAQVAL